MIDYIDMIDIISFMSQIMQPHSENVNVFLEINLHLNFVTICFHTNKPLTSLGKCNDVTSLEKKAERIHGYNKYTTMAD